MKTKLYRLIFALVLPVEIAFLITLALLSMTTARGGIVPGFDFGGWAPRPERPTFEYWTNNNGPGTITLWAYNGPGGVVTISDFVTNIRDPFMGCTSLTSIIIPDSVTVIQEMAFTSCGRLTNVTFGSSVTSIGLDAFAGCSSLRDVTLPASVTRVGSGAFGNCSGLAAIYVASSNHAYTSLNGVLFTRDQRTLVAFPAGNAATSYEIPGSVTRIGETAFVSCAKLTGITIPNSVISIGHDAFRLCANLAGVTIPNSVTNIGRGALSGCSSLTNITIPASVTRIGDQAFMNCPALVSVHFMGNPPKVGNNLFRGDNLATVIYRPGTTGWTSNFCGLPATTLTNP